MRTNNYRKIRFITLLLAILFVSSIGILFTSCDKDEDTGSTSVELLSYGPMPIARGAELRFIGENFLDVNSIILPDEIVISKVDFTDHTATSIKLIVPQDAVEGYVYMATANDTIKTLTQIGFDEPISIDEFSPASLKPGSELVITGDYLNLVGEVIFTNRVVVDSTLFITQERKQISLIVPAEAQTGKIAVSNAADDPIVVYSESELEVVIPAIDGISPNPVKSGTELTITGSDMDLVTQIIFGGDVTVTDFTVVDESTITVTVPLTAQDGVVTLKLASDVSVVSDDELVMVMPELSVAPTTIKNGESLTVSGENLDLISSVTFSSGVSGTIQSGGTETEIMVTVPDAAVSGEVTFYTTFGSEISGGTITIVNPVLSSFTPLSTKPNSDIVISGTDLDLVASIVFSGGVQGTVVAQSETEITVTVPVGAVTGVVTLVAINGVEVVSVSELEVLQNLPNFEYYTEGKGTPGEILTLNGTNMDLIKELVFPGEIVATAYGEKTPTKVEVYVPEDVTRGTGQIRLVTYEGEEGYLPELFFGGTDPITSETVILVDYEQHGDHNGWWDAGWSGNTSIIDEGDNMYLHVDDVISDGWIINCNHQANGAPAPVVENVENYVIKFDVKIEEGVTGAENASLMYVLGDGWYWYGTGLMPATTGGDWVTVSLDASALGLSGTLDMSSGTNGLYGGPIPGGISFDNLRLDPK
ncbi:glycan-binding surface protein [Carboxylicivirga caseinilyticus]|uniref:glycan-binding surface protein n=1 Tax=Carboxylicivirga caseinilyticus TaxID=3417572 RepID=UPI003D331679|nr:cell shape determination protein CcmA [Marinilabiliaceae bacterium A049]